MRKAIKQYLFINFCDCFDNLNQPKSGGGLASVFDNSIRTVKTLKDIQYGLL